MEAGGAVDGGGGAGGALQLGDLDALAQRVHDELGGQLGAQHVVGSDLAVDLNAVDGAVHGDDAHALGDGGLHSAGDGVGVHGVDDQHGDVLGDQVLDVGDLLGHVVTGVGDGQLDAQLVGGSLGAIHQSDEEGVVLGGDGQADGAVAHDLHLLGGLGGNVVIGVHVVLGDQSDLDGDGLLDSLAADQGDGVLHGGGADQSGLLSDGSGHLTGLDGFDGVVGGVEANHHDVLAGAGDSFHGAQSHLVVGGEDSLNVAVGLEHVLHDGHTLSAVEVGDLRGHHVQLLIGDGVEAGGAVDGGGSAGGALQLGDLDALAQGVHDVLGSQSSAGHVVGGDLAVDLNAVDGAVHGDDLDALGLGGLHSAGDGVGVHGVDDQHGDVLGNQVLDVGDLLGHVIAGVGHGQRHAQLGGGLLSALDQSDEEGVVLGGDGQTDGAVGHGGLCSGGLAVDGDLTAGHGKDHDKAQEKRS